VTAIDTACNYSSFASHRELRRAAGDLLHQFDVTTKAGYFPGRHDLSPSLLTEAAERAADELGRIPDMMLVHNPEESPSQFSQACRVMAGLHDQGWCGGWGISTWDPRPLSALPYDGPAPDTLMTRAGLMVPAEVLDAGDALAGLTHAAHRWGMAPFGHDARARVWQSFDPAVFLTDDQAAEPVEAALAAAFALPAVERIAVGTTSAAHLAQLHHARLLEPDPGVIARYRRLLRERASMAVPASDRAPGDRR
jgi:aryl-alcohol dehydrogenase-like predicted oxidoreductase